MRHPWMSLLRSGKITIDGVVLTEAQAAMLHDARDEQEVDVAGKGTGAHAAARALGRKRMITPVFERGGLHFGRWMLTDGGCRVASALASVKNEDA